MKDALTPARADNLELIAAELERDPRLKSHNSKRGYLADLRDFEQWRAGRAMTKLLVEEYASTLQTSGKSPTTINRKLAAVRWWARRLGDLAYEDSTLPRDVRQEITTQAARVASVSDVRGRRTPKGRHLTTGELTALLQTCANGNPADVRDAAIIALAWATGARRSELAGLTLADYQPKNTEGGDLRIVGKGDKARTEYVFNGAAAYLADWLTLRGTAEGPLFYAINKGGKIQTGHGVSDEALAQMLEKRRVAAGLRPLSWHDFRRTFAGNLLDNGADLVTVQKLMGHASPTTTSNYDRRGEETRRKASQSLHVPYLNAAAK